MALTSCFYLAAGLVLLISQTQSQVCLNGFQCLSCTQAQICVGATPSGDPFTCPASTYCLNANPQVCTVGSCPTSFTCTVAGRYPDPSNSNQYFICIPNGSSGLLQITVPCPAGSSFSPIALQCVTPTTTTSTTASTTTASTTSTTSTTTVATTTPIYSCSTIGRFPDARNCSIYYMCNPNPAGGFYVYRYTCPPTTLFNAARGKCTTAATSGCAIAG